MSSPLNEVRVLLVDDNAHMRAIIMSILEGIGVRQIHECEDGAAGLAALRDWPADLAIIDFQMSPVDGVEFTHLVRNAGDSANPYLPIIMMTGHSEKARVFEARDAGVTEFIVKPVTARAVIDRINAVIYRPRPFVRTDDYHGPCRRRKADPAHMGPLAPRQRQEGEEPGRLISRRATHRPRSAIAGGPRTIPPGARAPVPR